MMAAMLAAGGRRVGLYTSPHLVSFRERITIAGTPISEAAVVDGVARIRDVLGRVARPHLLRGHDVARLGRVSRRSASTSVVLEVGLGGRLDATNVVTPEVTVDHQRRRSTTRRISDTTSRASPARRPASSRRGSRSCRASTGVAADVVAARAAELASPLEVLERDFMLDARRRARRARATGRARGTIAPLTLALAGAHQHRNAALAIRALELAPALTPTAAAIAAGLAAVRWPGRLQVVCREPLVLLDGAHNAAGVEALVAEVRTRRRATPRTGTVRRDA